MSLAVRTTAATTASTVVAASLCVAGVARGGEFRFDLPLPFHFECLFHVGRLQCGHGTHAPRAIVGSARWRRGRREWRETALHRVTCRLVVTRVLWQFATNKRLTARDAVRRVHWTLVDNVRHQVAQTAEPLAAERTAQLERVDHTTHYRIRTNNTSLEKRAV